MKTTKEITLLLLLGILIVPAAMAEENTTNSTNSTDANLTDDDEEELEDFSVLPGAQLRFLQLERALSRNIIIGTETAEVIEKNHPDANVTRLTMILESMEDLLNETRSANLAGMEPIAAAEKFVGIKKQSINLTAEFRAEARKYANLTDRHEIMDGLRGAEGSLSELNKLIVQERKELNAARVNKTLSCMNATNPELGQLLESIRSGNITLDEIKGAAKGIFANLSQEKKLGAATGLKSCAVKRVQVAKQIREEVRSQLSNITANRLMKMSHTAERLSNAAEIRSRLMAELNNTARAQKMQGISERLEAWSDKMDMWSQRMQNRSASQIAIKAVGGPNHAGAGGGAGG
jgi:hypothetical protein